MSIAGSLFSSNSQNMPLKNSNCLCAKRNHHLAAKALNLKRASDCAELPVAFSRMMVAFTRKRHGI